MTLVGIIQTDALYYIMLNEYVCSLALGCVSPVDATVSPALYRFCAWTFFGW